MADTLTKIQHGLKRPKISVREPMFDGYLNFDETPPKAYDISLEDYNIIDPEIWRQGTVEMFANA